MLICHGMHCKPSVYVVLQKFISDENCGIKILFYANFYANHPTKYAYF